MTAAPKSGLSKGLKSASPNCCVLPMAVTLAPYFQKYQNAPNCIIVWHESVIYRAGVTHCAANTLEPTAILTQIGITQARCGSHVDHAGLAIQQEFDIVGKTHESRFGLGANVVTIRCDDADTAIGTEYVAQRLP